VDPRLAEVANDPNAYLDAGNALLYVDAFPTSSASTSDQPAPAPPTGAAIGQSVFDPNSTNPFALSSKPGSTKTIYLDFDGAVVENTVWNTSVWSSEPRTFRPYDLDGDYTTFAGEAWAIWQVWNAVAEDFAPFDVNVTTIAPPPEALERTSFADQIFGTTALISQDNLVCPGSCGGVAYIGYTGDPAYAPAFVFPTVGQTPAGVANTVSHEVGHNLGLNHHGTTTEIYYRGHGDWAPIMGFPYDPFWNTRRYSQWSKGEYANANRPNQDDLAIIRSVIGSHTDETDPTSGATPLVLGSAVTTTAAQVIDTADDTDYFAVNVTTGFLSARIQTPTFSNLRATISILNETGGTIAASDPSTSGGIVEATVPNGRYFVKIAGVGLLTPSTGFSSYASLGFYRLAVTQTDRPSNPTLTQFAPIANREFVVAWSESTTRSSGSRIEYAYNLCTDQPLQCVSGTTADRTLRFPIEQDQCGKRHQFSLRSKDQYGNISAAFLYSDYITSLCLPLGPSIGPILYDSGSREISFALIRGVEFAPVSVQFFRAVFRNRLTNESVTMTVPRDATSVMYTPPPHWEFANVEVRTAALTTHPSPFDITDGESGSVQLGRRPAPQGDPVTTLPRTDAPQAGPGTTLPRAAAPQS
jgi:Metallo-peptidase family M12B Reprolysin-like